MMLDPQSISAIAERMVAAAIGLEIPDTELSILLVRALPMLPHPLLLRASGKRVDYVTHLRARPLALDLGVYGWSGHRLQDTIDIFLRASPATRQLITRAAILISEPYLRGLELLHAIDAFAFLTTLGSRQATVAAMHSWRTKGKI